MRGHKKGVLTKEGNEQREVNSVGPSSVGTDEVEEAGATRERMIETKK